MRYLFLVYLLFATHFSFSQSNGPDIKDPSAWVTKQLVSYLSSDDNRDNGGYSYLLIDRQDNVITKEYFRHYAYRLETSEGVQEMSDISVSFDPSYEELAFHYVKHIRGAEVKNVLTKDRLKTIQRESSMERKLFDGRLTAILNLEDIREGDIIDYAYTIKGDNPIYKGHYFNTYYFDFGLPVERLYTRIVSNENNRYTYKNFNGLPAPSVKKGKNLTELIWEIENIEAVQTESNLPPWFDPYSFTSISDFKSWGEVVDWALPIYKISTRELEYVKKALPELTTGSSDEESILKAIRFVQDEVRYLGFEQGLSAIQPHKPTEVLSKRFGDCKDKSLLLVALLENLEIEAYPMLVNSSTGKTIGTKLPMPSAFDHCVVTYFHEGTQYFVDPTISNQRGGIKNIYFPAYEKGLVIKKGSQNLIDLPRDTNSRVEVYEEYELEEIDGDAKFYIQTVYYGSKADYQRSYFKSNDLKSIQESYLNYYANLFYKIEVLDKIDYQDYDDRFVVLESYHIKDGWSQHPEDSATIYFEFYPIMLEDYTRVSKSKERQMPYYLQYPNEFKQVIDISLPEDWNITPERTVHESEAFYYSSTIEGGGSDLSITYYYKTKKDLLKPSEVKDYFDKHDLINSDISYYITYNKSAGSGEFKVNAGITGLAILIFLAGSFYAVRVHRRYDPEPLSSGDEGIGGWLILIAIGLSISPFRLLIELYNSPEYFNSNLWDALLSGLNTEKSMAIGIFVIAELVINILLIVTSVLLLIQFFQRRTSLPRLLTIFLAFNIVFLIADIFVAEALAIPLSQADKDEAYKGIVRAIVAGAIWIPYFNISDRVKRTFVKRRNGRQGADVVQDLEVNATIA